MSMERFSHPEAIEEIIKHVGNIPDVKEEFGDIDKDGAGEVRFDCFITWAFKRSIEQKKIKEKE